jgi:predicted phage gp36 major capsid-like protein
MSSSLTTGQDVLLYGDFSRFYIIDRIGFTTEFIPNLFDTSTGRPTASRGWLSHWRTGSNAVDTNAFRLLRL